MVDYAQSFEDEIDENIVILQETADNVVDAIAELSETAGDSYDNNYYASQHLSNILSSLETISTFSTVSEALKGIVLSDSTVEQLSIIDSQLQLLADNVTVVISAVAGMDVEDTIDIEYQND